ncbi:hypothetical protein GA0115254_112514 [Streptomyces sp. Ncost-T10-10d]|nr:hypothetical protein GA0115254_112514 [Streptomyces sp. Ncost-T10-10d]
MGELHGLDGRRLRAVDRHWLHLPGRGGPRDDHGRMPPTGRRARAAGRGTDPAGPGHRLASTGRQGTTASSGVVRTRRVCSTGHQPARAGGPRRGGRSVPDRPRPDTRRCRYRALAEPPGSDPAAGGEVADRVRRTPRGRSRHGAVGTQTAAGPRDPRPSAHQQRRRGRGHPAVADRRVDAPAGCRRPARRTDPRPAQAPHTRLRGEGRLSREEWQRPGRPVHRTGHFVRP